MTEEPSNRELMHFIVDIRKDVKANLEQSTKTNGRVGALENEKYFIRGGLTVIGMVILPIIFIVIKLLIDR